MEGLKCVIGNAADCCAKLVANSNSFDSDEYTYYYLHICVFDMNGYITTPILVQYYLQTQY